MRSRRHLAAGVALSAALLAAHPGRTASAAGDPARLHREMLEILHGEPRRDVVPSPYYCWRHGRGPEKSQMPAFEWYATADGSCSAVYIPNLASVHSPLSDKGEIIHFFFDDEKYGRLEASLTRLASALETNDLSLGDQFDLQMTVWELIAALQFRRDIVMEGYPEISQDKVDRLLVPALKVLRATLFTPEQIAELPATLPALPTLSGEEAIAPLVTRLIGSHETIVEDRYPSQLHNAFSQGRLFGRVFITLADPQELERFQEFLTERPNTRLKGFSWQTSPALPEEELTVGRLGDVRDLPLRYSGLRTVLVLFFNVLNSRYEVVPTQMVAAWDELWWAKKLEVEDMRAADRVLGMRIIQYQKQLGLGSAAEQEGQDRFPVYRSISEDEISQVLFTNANPVHPGIQVTTVRAQCLSCHASKLMTFDMHRRLVSFVPPFTVTPEELEPREAEAEAGESFREWTRQYLETTEGER